MSVLTPLPQKDLHQYWPWMRKGLDAVLEKGGGDWIPEDMYVALKTNQVVAFSIGADDGFVIVRKDLRLNGPALFVWALWAPGMHAALSADVIDELKAMARHEGCARIIHEGRRGWERMGWKTTHCIYEMDTA